MTNDMNRQQDRPTTSTFSDSDTDAMNEEQLLLDPYLQLDNATKPFSAAVQQLLKELIAQMRAALPEIMSTHIARPRRILVVSSGWGGMHIAGRAGLVLFWREVARRYGSCQFDEWYQPESAIDASLLQQYDAVILNNLWGMEHSEWGHESESFYNESLPAYVAAGGGLFALHSAALMGSYYSSESGKAPRLTCDPRFDEYRKMLGGYGMMHPEHSCDPLPFEILEPAHPLMTAFAGESAPCTVTYFSPQRDLHEFHCWPVALRPPMELADELYVFSPDSNADHSVRVLLRIDEANLPADVVFPSDATPFSYAMIWVKRYGTGRVYYNQFGHFPTIFSLPCIARSLLDGLLYVTGDLIADDSPSALVACPSHIV